MPFSTASSVCRELDATASAHSANQALTINLRIAAASGPRWGSHHGSAAVSARHSHSPVQDQSRDRAATRYDLRLVQAGEHRAVALEQRRPQLFRAAYAR